MPSFLKIVRFLGGFISARPYIVKMSCIDTKKRALCLGFREYE